MLSFRIFPRSGEYASINSLHRGLAIFVSGGESSKRCITKIVVRIETTLVISDSQCNVPGDLR